MAPDEDLVVRLRRGDATAFSVILDRHRTRAVSFAARMTGDPDGAEALAHDAFVKMASEAGRGSSDKPFRVWLFSILHGLVSDFVTKNRPESRASLERVSSARGSADAAGERPPGETRELFTALMKLSPANREVLLLRVHEGMSYDEIAEVTGDRVATIRGRMNHAIEQLRKEVR